MLELINWPSFLFHVPTYRRTGPFFTDKQIAEFEERNFENYCHYHRTALKKMIKGTVAKEVFSTTESKLLRKHGVLLRKKGCFLVVSPQTIETLKNQR